MKITMYELLGLVKDGKAPKRIRIRSVGGVYDKEFYFDGNIYMYKDKYEEYAMTDDISIEMSLNDEVEILEEEKMVSIPESEYLKWLDFKNIACQPCEEYCEEKKIPEKLDKRDFLDNKTLDQVDADLDFIIDKINEIIDYLKSKGE